MRTAALRPVGFLVALLLVTGVSSGTAFAQESKSVPLVKELTALLDQAKLDAIAAREPGVKDGFVAALYFPGSQLLVVSAKYSAPTLLDEKITKKDFREIYTDLNSAYVPGSKTLVMDMGADGLKPKRDETRFDTCDFETRSVAFDGEWKKQKMASEDDYTKTFADADARYAKMISALIAQAKKIR